MGTNFYRIPSEEEMQDRKDRLWFRIVDLNMTPEFIERNFRYLGGKILGRIRGKNLQMEQTFI